MTTHLPPPTAHLPPPATKQDQRTLECFGAQGTLKLTLPWAGTAPPAPLNSAGSWGGSWGNSPPEQHRNGQATQEQELQHSLFCWDSQCGLH